MTTLTRRLRNSSLNGARFATTVNPEVKIHLVELNSILANAAFLVDPVSPGITKESKDKKQIVEVQNSLDKLSAKRQALQQDLDKAIADEADARIAHDAAPPDSKTIHMEEHREKAIKLDQAQFAFNELLKDWDKTNNLFQELISAVDSIGSNGHIHQEDGRVLFGQLTRALAMPLIAKKTTSDPWDNKGVLNLMVRDGKSGGNRLSIADCIDQVNKLSNLKSAFTDHLRLNWNTLDENQKSVLSLSDYPAVLDYLIAYAFFVKGVSEINALFNFIHTHRYGATGIVKYAIVSTARYMIQKNGVDIDEVGSLTYNSDEHPLILSLKGAGISLDEDAFKPQVERLFKDYILNGSVVSMLRKGLADIGMSPDEVDNLPASFINSLIAEVRKSPVKIKPGNISVFLPSFLEKVQFAGDEVIKDDEPEPDADDSIFNVQFDDDEKSVIKTNVSIIRCAAQLFSSMIMDSELDLFSLVNYLTNNYLIRNRVDIEDRKLSVNLQQFVFSNRFVDPSTKERMDRTDPLERQHFYRQVFNIGAGEMPQGAVVNAKFPRLWGQLVPAVKKYLDETSASLSEDTFVSKGGVMQIVNGLKNNLSANCTSMAKIISPVIDAEWHFIKDKILGHPEIIRQVSPAIGSWKGVAETLYAEMKQRTIDASLLYDKARLSNGILRKVAEYDPRQFEDQDNFIDFCGLVIELDSLNQSISDYATDESEDDSASKAAVNDAYANAGIQGLPGLPNTQLPLSPNGNGKPNGEWDF